MRPRGGWSVSVIASHTGQDRKTVRKQTQGAGRPEPRAHQGQWPRKGRAESSDGVRGPRRILAEARLLSVRLSLDALSPLLQCPASQQPLDIVADGSLRTPDGSHRYAVLKGVPLLLDAERSLFDPEALIAPHASSRSRGPLARARPFISRFLHGPPSNARNVSASANYSALARLLLRRGEATGRRMRILVVGGGTAGSGADDILVSSAFDVVETDVYVGPRTQVVCDAHDLPFAPGSFDAVICQAVLEHVLDPWRVAQEIWRVLRLDGLVYSEIPFIQQVHLGAFDFTRFTLLGHRRLWRSFDEISSGAQCGPGMALIWSIQAFCRAPFPRMAWPVIDRLTSLAFFWLKYFDDRLVTTPGGLDAASGTFFLGAKRLTAIEDRVLVRGYRGGGPRLP